MSTAERMKADANSALQFVNKKYQKDFEPSTYEMADYLSETDRVHCYTEGMNPEKEHVEVYVVRDGEEVKYLDNYFGFHIRPEAEAYIGSMVEKEFKEFKVFRDSEYEAFPNELTCESTLEDLYRVKSAHWMNVKVYINGDDNMSEAEYQEKVQRIEQELLDSNHRYTIYIFAVSDEVYQSLDRYNQDDFWRFYAQNRKPDGEKYFYVYKNTIQDGKVK